MSSAWVWVCPLLAATMVGTGALGSAASSSTTLLASAAAQQQQQSYDDLQLEDIEELDESLFLDDSAVIPKQQQQSQSNDEDAWRASENWWKDPLAQFEEEEDEEDVYSDAVQSDYEEEDFDAEIQDLLEQESEEDVVEEPEIAKPVETTRNDIVEKEQMAAKIKEEKEKRAELAATRLAEKRANQEKKAAALAERLAAKKLEREQKSKALAERRLERQQNARMMREQVRDSFSAPVAVLLPVIPKVRAFISTHPPVQVLGLALLAKSLLLKHKVFPKLNGGDTVDDDSLYGDYDNLDEQGTTAIVDDLDEPSFKVRRPDFLERIVQIVPSGGNRVKIPPAKQLLEERDSLLLRAERAESERDNMEREYEKSSWQLQEVQSDLTAQASTTRYLKAQLRDTEQMLERAVRAERDRAREELKRMKEAMLRVLERERQGMRDEVKRQTAELQALLKEANNGGE